MLNTFKSRLDKQSLDHDVLYNFHSELTGTGSASICMCRAFNCRILYDCKGPRVQLPLSPKFAVKESHTNSRRASSVYL